jgi:hypothetical protein
MSTETSVKPDKRKTTKTIPHPNDQEVQIWDPHTNEFMATYYPNIGIDIEYVKSELDKVPFTQVVYPSKYQKTGGPVKWNTTRRYSYCYSESVDEWTEYKGLHFEIEALPPFVTYICDYVNTFVESTSGFNPGYNSIIMGKYVGKDHNIAFHTDTERFLASLLCANLTITTTPRDFQFRDSSGDRHQIALADGSCLFFDGLEHSLPKRAGTPTDCVRYSLSLRTILKRSEKGLHIADKGSGNHYYYCRGLASAVENKYPVEMDIEEKQHHTDLKDKLKNGKITWSEYKELIRG